MKAWVGPRVRAAGALGLLVVAAGVAVFAMGWALMGSGAERAAAVGSLVLGLTWLALHWPNLSCRWVAPACFLLGCVLGVNGLFHGLAEREGDRRHAMAVESVVFEQSAESLLNKGDCKAGMAFLEADLQAAPYRPAPSLVIRADVWRAAVAQGCATRSEWHAAQRRLQALVETAPLTIQGVSRDLLRERIGG